MKFRRVLLVLAVCLCLTTICVSAQAGVSEYKGKTRVTMGSFGTVSSLCIYDDFSRDGALEKYDAVWSEIKTILEQLDLLLSTSIETSEIARFNALESGGEMHISSETAEVFQLARQMYEKTNGRFDPTVFPLVDLWGFSPRFTFGSDEQMPYDRPWENGTRALPDDKYISGFMQLVNMDGIALIGDEQQGYTLKKNTPSVMIDGIAYHARIDLGGIAKGYAVDRIARLLEERGYAYGYFSCGSSSIRLLKNASYSAQKNGEASFELQVRIPRKTAENKDAYAIIRVMDQSLSSSGDYDNNYMSGGNLCCHIIDTRTGYPVNFNQDGVQGGISTVTLLSGSAVEDDALTTALCLMGVHDAIAYVNENLRDHSVAMVLYRADKDFYEVVTNIPESGLQIFDGAYRLASRMDEQGRIVYTGTLFKDAL